jgi:hypothetical protein
MSRGFFAFFDLFLELRRDEPGRLNPLLDSPIHPSQPCLALLLRHMGLEIAPAHTNANDRASALTWKPGRMRRRLNLKTHGLPSSWLVISILRQVRFPDVKKLWFYLT